MQAKLPSLLEQRLSAASPFTALSRVIRVTQLRIATGYASATRRTREALGFAARSGERIGRRARATVLFVAVFAAMLFGRVRSVHAEENPLGIALGFGIGGAMALGGLPLFLAAEDDAPISIGLALGAGGQLDSFSTGFELEGNFAKGSPWGLTSRVRADFLVDPEDEASRVFPLGVIRWDVAGTGVIAGASNGPAALSGVAGATFMPSTVDPDRSGDTDLHGALGAIVGLRFQMRSDYVDTRVELDYVPILLESPTFHVHNLDLEARIGVSPWAAASPVTMELSLRREIGLGEGTSYNGTVATLGVRFQIDEVPEAPQAEETEQAAKVPEPR